MDSTVFALCQSRKEKKKSDYSWTREKMFSVVWTS